MEIIKKNPHTFPACYQPEFSWFNILSMRYGETIYIQSCKRYSFHQNSQFSIF